jgi:lipoate-protein ligase A
MWMDNWVLNMPLDHWPLYKNKKHPVLFRLFESKKNLIVLSSSNQAQIETNLDKCINQNIPILRRKGGGGTVVLGPGCLILTFAFYAKDVFSNGKYFNKINQLWIDSIASQLSVTLTQNGISDICYKEKKIAGTSIFRKKHLLVYQGSLLVNPNLNSISELLSHPSKEPDYRNGRSHQDFLTTLHHLGYKKSAEELAVECSTYFEQNVYSIFKDDFYTPLS